MEDNNKDDERFERTCGIIVLLMCAVFFVAGMIVAYLTIRDLFRVIPVPIPIGSLG